MTLNTRIPGHPDEVDLHVGLRLRAIRRERKWSQQNLAEILNISYQQVQKYERGSNRVSASRLWHMAQALDIPVAEFFADLPESPEHRAVASGFMAWAVTPRGLRWITLGMGLDDDSFPLLADIVAMVNNRRR